MMIVMMFWIVVLSLILIGIPLLIIGLPAMLVFSIQALIVYVYEDGLFSCVRESLENFIQ